MEGILAFLGVIGCLFFFGAFISVFIILSRTGSILEKVESMHRKILSMGNEISQLRGELLKHQPDSNQTKTEEIKTVFKEETVQPVLVPEEKQEEIPPVEIKQEVVTPPVPVEEESALLRIESEEIIREEALPKEEPLKQTLPREKTFFEKNPDLEKFIGENLINKIGIAILVIGIGFFVKFAIDQDWINEIGRVFIGIVCGGILVGLAHYTRNSFKAFSSVLVGGGMAVFYLTIAIAFHEYKLMPQTLAFAIMVLITLFSVILSIAYDRKELAVLALIGGFASPFMVSTGEGNYKVLFTYVLILNIGMLVLSYFKRWNIVNVISFVFTILLFGGWLVKIFSSEVEPRPYAGALLFATVFYLVFFLMNIINNIRENKTFLAFELTILIANTFLYYSAGMLILKSIQEGMYQGLFTVIIAVFNFVFAYVLFKNKKVDNNLVYLLIGLVLTFVTLSAPIQLKGNYITLFWAAESLLLLWLSQKSGIRIMKLGSVLITTLMMISLIMDWNNVYMKTGDVISIIFNKAFVTSLVVLASISGSIFLMRNEGEKLLGELDKKSYAVLLELLFIFVSYTGGILEVHHQFMHRLGLGENMRDVVPIYTGCYNLVYVLMISVYIHYKKIKWLEIFPVGFCVLLSMAYLLYYNGIVVSVRDSYLLFDTVYGKHYFFHYLNVVLLVFILLNALRIVNKNYPKTANEYNVFLWFSCFIAVFLASVELENMVLVSAFEKGTDLYSLKHQNYKVGFPILWGVCSFALMALGMKMKIKMLRIISLTLFAIALVKMFVFDIREMSEGGKIAAFISLGVLLLIISFMYQKLKKILTEE